MGIGLGAALLACGVVVLVAWARGDLERVFGEPPPTGLFAEKGVYELPAFELEDTAGQTVSRSNLEGVVWVADFGLTRCRGICPVLAKRMGEIQAGVKADPELGGVQLFTIAVDPAHDTREVLAAYAEEVGADPGRWNFLRSDQATVWTLVREGFGFAVGESIGDETTPIMHTQKMVLVDRQGRVRGFYDGMVPASVEVLLADLRRVVAE